MAEILHEYQDCFQRQGKPAEVSEPGAPASRPSHPMQLSSNLEGDKQAHLGTLVDGSSGF